MSARASENVRLLLHTAHRRGAGAKRSLYLSKRGKVSAGGYTRHCNPEGGRRGLSCERILIIRPFGEHGLSLCRLFCESPAFPAVPFYPDIFSYFFCGKSSFSPITVERISRIQALAAPKHGKRRLRTSLLHVILYGKDGK